MDTFRNAYSFKKRYKHLSKYVQAVMNCISCTFKTLLVTRENPRKTDNYFLMVLINHIMYLHEGFVGHMQCLTLFPQLSLKRIDLG